MATVEFDLGINFRNKITLMFTTCFW